MERKKITKQLENEENENEEELFNAGLMMGVRRNARVCVCVCVCWEEDAHATSSVQFRRVPRVIGQQQVVDLFPLTGSSSSSLL